MSLVRPITRRDIKGPALYGPIRDDYRKHVIELKRARRILIGDRVSLVFENRHTLSVQIEEICRVENSAVQYTRYPLALEARTALQTPGTALAFEIDHPNYRHRVACSEATRAALAADYA